MPSREKETPKPCPFCAGAELEMTRGDKKNWWIQCNDCGAIGPWDIGKSGAMDAWNRAERFPKQRPLTDRSQFVCQLAATMIGMMGRDGRTYAAAMEMLQMAWFIVNNVEAAVPTTSKDPKPTPKG